MVPGGPRDRNVRSRRRCSMCPAIHINSRSWLRSSSTHEPSDPPLRVVSQQISCCRGVGATVRRTARLSAARGAGGRAETASHRVLTARRRRQGSGSGAGAAARRDSSTRPLSLNLGRPSAGCPLPAWPMVGRGYRRLGTPSETKRATGALSPGANTLTPGRGRLEAGQASAGRRPAHPRGTWATVGSLVGLLGRSAGAGAAGSQCR